MHEWITSSPQCKADEREKWALHNAGCHVWAKLCACARSLRTPPLTPHPTPPHPPTHKQEDIVKAGEVNEKISQPLAPEWKYVWSVFPICAPFEQIGILWMPTMYGLSRIIHVTGSGADRGNYKLRKRNSKQSALEPPAASAGTPALISLSSESYYGCNFNISEKRAQTFHNLMIRKRIKRGKKKGLIR